MIKRGEFSIAIENVPNTVRRFDSMLVCSDWRFSATAVGLKRYFDFCNEKLPINSDKAYVIYENAIFYNKDDIILEKNESEYFEFVYEYFSDKMHHKKLLELLENPISEEAVSENIENINSEYDAKNQNNDKGKKKKKQKNPYEIYFEQINELMSANTVMKKMFSGVKYAPENIEQIKRIILDNKLQITKETYKNGMALYRNFCNMESLGSEDKGVCRLLGYYIDLPKKKKSIAFNWDYGTFVYDDYPEFDYISFGFSKGRESFFINNNFSVKELTKANEQLLEITKDDENINCREAMFLETLKSSSFIDYEVEIITKKEIRIFLNLCLYKILLLRFYN